MFSRSRRTRRTVRALASATAVVAVAGAGLAGVAGCAGGAPSEAAVVGGRSVSQSDVERGVQGLSVALNVPVERINPQNVVGALISGVQADQIAAANHITITDAQRDATLAGDQTGAQLLQQADAKELAYDLADAQIVSQQLGVQKYLADTEAIPVRLNPRYGSWKNGQMVGDTGSLSQPASPSPSPSF